MIQITLTSGGILNVTHDFQHPQNTESVWRDIQEGKSLRVDENVTRTVPNPLYNPYSYGSYSYQKSYTEEYGTQVVVFTINPGSVLHVKDTDPVVKPKWD